MIYLCTIPVALSLALCIIDWAMVWKEIKCGK